MLRYVTAEGIRRAYLLNAWQHHPDLHPGDRSADTRMQAINEAYATLSDPVSRSEYDASSGKVYIPSSPPDIYSGQVSWSGHSRSARKEPGIVETAAAAFARVIRYVVATIA